jgi:hypothetical protein
VTVDVEVSVAGAVGCVKQLSTTREFDQDVGLGGPASAGVAIFFGDGLVERSDSTTYLFQLCT